MRRNIIETVLGAVVLLVAAGFLIFAFQSSGLSSAANGYQVVAEFDDASGLSPGTDVRMSGVKIGTVISQSLDPETYFAKVVLSIDEQVRLPTDTSARIVPEGLLGNNHVALEPGAETEMIEPGGQIVYTQGAVNVVDLLGRFVFGSAEETTGGASP